MMTNSRRAYTLLEMIAIIAAVVVLMALSVKPLRTMISDIPRANRDFQTWIQTQDMLKQLKSDVEQSTAINVVDADSQTGGKQLSLLQPEERVIYSLADGDIFRRTDTAQTKWQLPHVHINWHVWDNKGNPYALEITTWTERTVFNKTRKTFEQSSVYFQQTGSLKP